MQSADDILRKFNIRAHHAKTGNQTTNCPKCSHLRKKKRDRCLSVKIDSVGVQFHCHHCGYDLSGSTGVSPRSLSGSMPEQSLPEQPAPEQPSLMVTCPECGTSCSLQREKPEELIPIPTGKARPIGRRRGPGL